MPSEVPAKTSGSSWWWLLLLIQLAYWEPHVWHSNWRYAIKYGVSSSKLTKPDMPKGCDWLRAPLGDKDCHYEAQAAIRLKGRDQYGKALESFDNGVNWYFSGDVQEYKPEVFKGSIETVAVVLSWEQKDGD